MALSPGRIKANSAVHLPENRLAQTLGEPISQNGVRFATGQESAQGNEMQWK